MKIAESCAAALVVWALAGTGPLLRAGMVEVVRPEFLNELKLGAQNPPVTQSSSMSFFGGNIDSIETAPSGTIPGLGPEKLVESSFGQALATDIPYPDFVHDSIREAQAILYAPANWARAEAASSDKVFRYKVLLFGGNSNGVAADPSQMATYFGSAERQRFLQAVRLMRDALKYAPYDRDLRNTLLDAYYDLAAAEAQFAKADRAELAKYRLGLQAVPPTDFIIDYEVRTMTNLMARYESALSRYGDLLTDTLGVDMSEYDPRVTNGMPLGAYIFQREQPFRDQYAAQFYDADGILKTVPRYDPDSGLQTNALPRILFAGYKDYVSLLGLLREYTAGAADLARLYAMRNRRAPGDDILQAYNLIDQVQRETQLEVLLLRGMFPGFEPAAGDASGLHATLNGLGTGLAELDNVRSFLDGKSNLLGFHPHFLILVKEAPEGQTNRFDSYDALMYWIGGRGTPSPFTPLGYADIAFDTARASFDTYKGNADQVRQQLSQIADTYGARYHEITGWDPGDVSTNHLLAPVPGSELWQANQNLAMANSRVQSLAEQSAKLDATIRQANQLVDLATTKSSRLDGALAGYFDSTADTWDNLHNWTAAMALSQNTYNTIKDVGTLMTSAAGADVLKLGVGAGAVAAVGLAGAANIIVQTQGALESSQAKQALDQAAAEFDVAKLSVNIPTEIAQAKIEYQDRLRERVAFTLEMLDAQAVQGQELARRSVLVRELERIKQQAQESDATLADRYYADPVHYLRAQNDMIQADAAFNEAQRWVFFTLRALEFKWNRDFAITWLNKDWELSSVFKLRNYAELEQMVGAMEEFNRINLIGFNRESFVDVISLRDDIMAPAAGGSDGLWLDVATGERVTSTNLLRRKLSRSVDPEGNLVIPLNTFALKKETGFLFLGPRYRNDGTLLSAGKYLDKIDWIKFNVVGTHTPANRDANLSYGGTCYVRTRVPPCADLANPSRLQGEYGSFPFYYFVTLDNGVTWQTRKAQEDTVKVAFTQLPGEPANPLLANQFLKERSVAATDWVLSLPAGSFNINQINDIEIWISHLFVTREIPACP